MDDFLARVKERLIPKGGVQERTVKSGIWMGAIRASGRALQFVKLIILARLLAPSDFGLMGIALLSLAALQRFSNLGFDAALIQQKEDDVDEYLNTAWVVKLIRGVALSGVLFVFAPTIATFFDMPRATNVVRGLAALPILVGLRNPGLVYLSKDLQFHKRFVFDFTGNFVNFAGAVGFALVDPSVWALVFGNIVEDVVRAVVSYWLHDYRPWPVLNVEVVRDLFGYGRWILGSGILVFLANQGDDAFVGWLLGASALGFYQLAYRFSNAPATEITHTISNVMFPAYSRVQDDVDRLREGYFKTLQVTTMVSFPMAFGIVVVAPSFVRVFLGTEWLPMIGVMQLLAVWGLIRSVGATVGPLFNAVGRPDYNTKLQLLKLVLIAAFIYPATTAWGILGTAAVIVGSAAVVNPVADYVALRQIEADPVQFLRLLAYPALGSSIMALSVLFVRESIPSANVAGFGLLVVTGVAAYSLVMFSADRQFGYDIRSTLEVVVEAVR